MGRSDLMLGKAILAEQGPARLARPRSQDQGKLMVGIHKS